MIHPLAGLLKELFSAYQIPALFTSKDLYNDVASLPTVSSEIRYVERERQSESWLALWDFIADRGFDRCLSPLSG